MTVKAKAASVMMIKSRRFIRYLRIDHIAIQLVPLKKTGPMTVPPPTMMVKNAGVSKSVQNAVSPCVPAGKVATV